MCVCVCVCVGGGGLISRDLDRGCGRLEGRVRQLGVSKNAKASEEGEGFRMALIATPPRSPSRYAWQPAFACRPAHAPLD